MLLDPAAQSASLDNDYGATKGANAAAAHEVALFNGDPTQGGTELDSTVGGYARVVLTNNGTNWPAASSGAKTSAAVPFAASTAAWSDTATWFVLFDHADSVTRWDAGLLDSEVSVDAVGDVASPTLTIFYSNEGA